MFFNGNGFYPQTTAPQLSVHGLWIDILIKRTAHTLTMLTVAARCQHQFLGGLDPQKILGFDHIRGSRPSKSHQFWLLAFRTGRWPFFSWFHWKLTHFLHRKLGEQDKILRGGHLPPPCPHLALPLPTANSGGNGRVSLFLKLCYFDNNKIYNKYP